MKTQVFQLIPEAELESLASNIPIEQQAFSVRPALCASEECDHVHITLMNEDREVFASCSVDARFIGRLIEMLSERRGMTGADIRNLAASKKFS